MQNRYLFFVLLTVLVKPVFGQDGWGETGTSWYYTAVWADISLMTAVTTVENTGDTIVLGQQCSILETDFQGELNYAWNCGDMSSKRFMYADSGKVFYYNAGSQAFGLLYDFNRTAGASWTVPVCEALGWWFDSIVVTVDSITHPTVSGQVLQYQHVSIQASDGSYDFGQDIIAKGMGSLTQMFLIRDASTAHFWITGLRCYEFPQGSTIKFTEQPCGYISDTREPSLGNGFKIAPNPVLDAASILFENPIEVPATACVFDCHGRLVQELELAAGTASWQVEGLVSGIYLFALRLNGLNLGTQKFIKL